MIGSRLAPFEGGSQSSLNPAASMVGLAGGLVAAIGDVAIGRFAWADLSGGAVSNVYGAPYTQLGFIPISAANTRGWGNVYWNCGSWYVRQGLPVTLFRQGNFRVQFPQGCSVGAQVWANPANGCAYAANGGNYIATAWTAMGYAGANGYAPISSWQPPIST